jgi:hypothetical protein
VDSKKKSDHPWLDDQTKKDDMKTLSATELAVLRRFIKDVIEVIQCDDTGITYDLDDGAAASAEILGIVYMPLSEQDRDTDDYENPVHDEPEDY